MVSKPNIEPRNIGFPTMNWKTRASDSEIMTLRSIKAFLKNIFEYLENILGYPNNGIRVYFASSLNTL